MDILRNQMNEREHLRQTLDYYRKLRQQKLDQIKPFLEELKPVEAMIRQLEIDLGEPPSVESAPITEPVRESANAPATGRPAALLPDQFFGMSQSEAAKAYLRLVGRAITFDELVEALQRGGAKLGGADPKKTLYVSLLGTRARSSCGPQKI